MKMREKSPLERFYEELERGDYAATGQDEPLPDDPYSARLQKALMTMCTKDYPAGLVPWLDTAHPALYSALTEVLPNEIHRLWSEGAPLADFDSVLAKMLATQHEAIALYRAANTRGRMGSANS